MNSLFGLEILLRDTQRLRRLSDKRLGLVAHPASVTHSLEHAVDILSQNKQITLTAAFGPQHGMRGDKQDNMVESSDYRDPFYHFPVFSLYGQTRRPTAAMMDYFDVLLFDVQDIGCRIYTFLTTLGYVMEACAIHKKELWVLDRPNPAGRPIEGFYLEKGQESFVGLDRIVMRHGLTLGEAALWYKKKKNLDLELEIVTASNYHPNQSPGWGWPDNLPWVNPSPNASSLNMARCFAGTVLIEGTTLSEGRGTTIALEVVGAPDIDIHQVLKKMEHLASHWMNGCKIRPCFFEPTFHKHKGKLCQGFQLHADDAFYRPEQFKPFRLISLFLKAIRHLYPDYPLWQSHLYEYEKDRLAIDVINGGPKLREWVDDPSSQPSDLELLLRQDEKEWAEERQPFLKYPIQE